MLKYNTSRTGKQQAPSDGDLFTRGGVRRGREEHRGVPTRGDVREAPLSSLHIRPRIVYKAGASIFTVTKGQTCEAPIGGKRGGIKGFSAASRRRLMRLIGSIRRDAQLPLFVTLTYPDKFPDVERAKRDLQVFVRRLKRAYPGCGAIWKLEPQQRGAPHYHMLVWGCSVVDLLPWVVQNWYDIAGDDDYKHYLFHAGKLPGSEPCVSQVRSFRGVWSYASKYLGKTFEVAEWGSKWTGRFWGVINKSNVPFGADREIPVTFGQACHIMRYQRRFTHIRMRSNTNSFTIFCDAEQWVNRIGGEDPPPASNTGVENRTAPPPAAFSSGFGSSA